MLKINNYSITEIENLKDFFIVSFVIIDDIYQEIIPNNMRNRKNINLAILSDSNYYCFSLKISNYRF